jgi:hypothetical protein
VAIYPTPIAANALDLKPLPPEFARSFHSTVGDFGTNLDGFSVIFNNTARSVGGWGAIFTKLKLCLAKFGVASTPIATPFEADAENSLAANLTAGQPAIDAFAVHLTGQNPPGAQPAGPPVEGGGGLQPVAFGRVPVGAASKVITVGFKNPQNFVIHPTGIKIEQGKLQVFVAHSECGASIPANGECNIKIEFRPLLPGHYTGLLVLTTDDPDSPYTISLTGTVTGVAAAGGTGGTGGPGAANDPFDFGQAQVGGYKHPLEV